MDQSSIQFAGDDVSVSIGNKAAAVGDPRNPRDAIRFYESAGGKLLATVNVPARSLADVQDAGPRTMRWSPDGSRLLLLDPSLQLATIWGPGTLPK